MNLLLFFLLYLILILQVTQTKTQAQFPNTVSLASLSFPLGYKIYGEAPTDLCGQSVSSAGDINNDGFQDFLIGAPNSGEGGRTYIIFGGPSVGLQGVIQLAFLGKNGIIISGQNADQIGMSVSGYSWNSEYNATVIGAPNGTSSILNSTTGVTYLLWGDSLGNEFNVTKFNVTDGIKFDSESIGDGGGTEVNVLDVDGDGLMDLLIGAPGASPPQREKAGITYLIFGKVLTNKTDFISLANLTQEQGVKIYGEASLDYSGRIVSSGDLNGDLYDEIVICAPNGGLNASGRCYIIYGGTGIGQNGIIDLATLKDSGFIIDGESANDYFGSEVSSDDFNNDSVSDLLIGAPFAGQKEGRSYILFGRPKLLINGTFKLSQLNGNNGFTILGENPGDCSGKSVSTAGDFNGDGIQDIIITAPEASHAAGIIYIVFGSPEIGQSGVLKLTDLNGQNGFRLKGESIQGTNLAVSNAGDVNGDKIDDIIVGASNDNRAYVLYGDAPPILINNSLTITSLQSRIITSNDMAATDMNHDDETLIFSIDNPQHCHFESLDNPGTPIPAFKQGDIWKNKIMFFYDQSLLPPSYGLTVRSESLAFTGPVQASVSFLVLLSNQLTLNRNDCRTLTTNLTAVDSTGINPSLIFLISNVTNGHFRWFENADSVLLQFSQENQSNKEIQFCHDGSDAPSYYVSVTDGKIQTEPMLALINFNPTPTISINQIVVQNDPVTLTRDNLCAGNCIENGDDFVFIVQNLRNGYFRSNDTKITSFWQEKVLQGEIEFVPNGSLPSYQIVAQDALQLVSAISNVDSLSINSIALPINEAEIFTLDGSFFNVSSLEEDAIIIFTVVTNTAGFFARTSKPQESISTFQRTELLQQQIIFVPNGSVIPPTCSLNVSSNRGAHGSFDCTIDFVTAPRLLHSYLNVLKDLDILLTELNFLASDSNNNRFPPSALVYEVLFVTGGYFAFVDWNKSITKFTQQDISDGKIYFIVDSDKPPSFVVSVSNGRMSCIDNCPRAAEIFSNPVTEEQWYENSLFISGITFLGTMILTWGCDKCKNWFARITNPFANDLRSKLSLQFPHWETIAGYLFKEQVDRMVVALDRLIRETDSSSPILPTPLAPVNSPSSVFSDDVNHISRRRRRCWLCCRKKDPLTSPTTENIPLSSISYLPPAPTPTQLMHALRNNSRLRKKYVKLFAKAIFERQDTTEGNRYIFKEVSTCVSFFLPFQCFRSWELVLEPADEEWIVRHVFDRAIPYYNEGSSWWCL